MRRLENERDRNRARRIVRASVVNHFKYMAHLDSDPHIAESWLLETEEYMARKYRPRLWRRVAKRFRAALRTNETQASAVAGFSLLNVLALVSREEKAGAPWWAWLAVGMLWPATAYFANLLDPIPAPRDDQECEEEDA